MAQVNRETQMQMHPSQILDVKQSSKPSIEPVADDVPPDGGYGWVCVACCFTVNAMTWGVNSVSGLSPGGCGLWVKY